MCPQKALKDERAFDGETYVCARWQDAFSSNYDGMMVSKDVLDGIGEINKIVPDAA